MIFQFASHISLNLHTTSLSPLSLLSPVQKTEAKKNP